ncbi:MAG: hypothetical protein AAFY26_24165 [Cyanobacteria bacterium J06638_22]
MLDFRVEMLDEGDPWRSQNGAIAKDRQVLHKEIAAMSNIPASGMPVTEYKDSAQVSEGGHCPPCPQFLSPPEWASPTLSTILGRRIRLNPVRQS